MDVNTFLHNMESMRSEVVRIRPEYAAKLLQRNAKNRNLRPALVSKYADDMQSGRWQLTHQGIALNKRGDLVDGQHRLAAVVKSGVDVDMMVTFNVDTESALDNMFDVGLKRSVSDITGIGPKDASIATFLLYLLKGRYVRGLSPALIRNIYDLQEVQIVCENTDSYRTKSVLPAVAAVQLINGADVGFVRSILNRHERTIFPEFRPIDTSYYKQAQDSKSSAYKHRIAMASKAVCLFHEKYSNKDKCYPNTVLLDSDLKKARKVLKQRGFEY